MDYRRMISLGRKAGLNTNDLYRAMATRRPEASDRNSETADGNGYVPFYGANGQRIFRPANLSRP